MRPSDSILRTPQTASPAAPERELAAGRGRADSPVAGMAATGVLCAAVASILWYVVDALLAL
jgi:hypothetical protein